MSSEKIVVIAHALKSEASAVLRNLRKWAAGKGYDVVTNLAEGIEPGSSASRTQDMLLPDEELTQRFQGARCAITLGGDGTLLYAAHLVAPLGIPVLAVHLGSLGFHTQVETARLHACLDSFLRDECRIEHRMLLQVIVETNGGAGTAEHRRSELLALNDVVVSKSAWGRMVHLRIHVDDRPASDLYADGLLIATPTGSSAYNYAARGPVLEPRMEAIVVNAICPHRINFSPVVLEKDHVIKVEFHPRKPSEEAQLLVDGRPWGTVSHLDILKICRAPVYLRLVVFEDRFFEKLREKLAWGGLFWKAAS
ncbi:MAG: NAD(+)/NADH kinase [Candidatus Sumerlaeaceae bacterium]